MRSISCRLRIVVSRFDRPLHISCAGYNAPFHVLWKTSWYLENTCIHVYLLLFQAPFTETDRTSLALVEACEVKVRTEVTTNQRDIKGALSGLFSSPVTDTALYDNVHVKVYSRAFIRPTEDSDLLVDTRRTEINALSHTTAATTTCRHQRTKFPRLGRAWKAIKKLCCCCCGTEGSD